MLLGSEGYERLSRFATRSASVSLVQSPVAAQFALVTHHCSNVTLLVVSYFCSESILSACGTKRVNLIKVQQNI